ncbi:unnamed protein product [Haemonchus placei]|uniref:Collagen-like protein n=1 Tax=Haemonchus placei TaxID=6290 RepID=A0A0N4WW02_HAEPC|nr:unnamed protein product [Haemonchus placei]
MLWLQLPDAPIQSFANFAEIVVTLLTTHWIHLDSLTESMCNDGQPEAPGQPGAPGTKGSGLPGPLDPPGSVGSPGQQGQDGNAAGTGLP